MKFYNFHSNKIDISENTHVIQVRFVRAENIKYFMYLLSLTNISSVTNNEDKRISVANILSLRNYQDEPDFMDVY